MNPRTSPTTPIWLRSNMWFGVFIGLMLLLIIHSIVNGPGTKELKYSELKTELAAGSIIDISVSAHEIKGHMRDDTGKSISFLTHRGGLENDASLLEQLDQQGVEVTGTAPPSRFVSFLVYLIPWLIMIGVFVLMMRRMSGNGSAMSFSKSKAKLYGTNQVHATFEDIAGVDEAITEVRELVDYLKTPQKYQSLGGKMPKGILLVGPPGTGKTLLARAVAGEADVPFFSISGSDFVEMFVGVGAARVRDLFQQARLKAPCIIFIDEIDALGKARSSSTVGGHDEREQTLNQLLVAMDGFDANAGIIVMAATNRPETLDKALLRPGRFDRTVSVDRPDIHGRKDILEIHARNARLDDSVDLSQLAKLTPGFVGADLANMINEAALLAARAGKTTIEQKDLEDSIERVIAGVEKKTRVLSGSERQRVAIHEAGHALMSLLLPATDPVHKVSIVPRGNAALGYTLHRPNEEKFLMTESELEGKIMVLLAGTESEREVLGEISSGAQSDLERATQIARHMVTQYGMSPVLGKMCYGDDRGPFEPPEHAADTARQVDGEIRRILTEATQKVQELLKDHRSNLEFISTKLLDQEVLSRAELLELVPEYTPA